MFRNKLRELKLSGEASNSITVWNEAFQLGGYIYLEPIVLGI
jgi:hypothetical protein